MDLEMVAYLSETLKMDDLPNEDLQLVAKDLGMDAIVKLILNHSGVYIYVPKELKKKLKKMYVLRNFDGSNAKSLARKLDISERSVYDWVHEADAGKNSIKFEQGDILEDLFSES